MGRVSKIILQDICATLRIALNINQWRNTHDCIKWFKEHDKNNKCSFVKYDIKEFYSFITEKTLDKALELASEYISIPQDKIEVIKHCRKTLLYYDNSIWIKKGAGGNFDTPMGAFDGAKICELVGCLLLYNLNNIVHPYSHGSWLWVDYLGQ